MLLIHAFRPSGLLSSTGSRLSIWIPFLFLLKRQVQYWTSMVFIPHVLEVTPRTSACKCKFPSPLSQLLSEASWCSTPQQFTEEATFRPLLPSTKPIVSLKSPPKSKSIALLRDRGKSKYVIRMHVSENEICTRVRQIGPSPIQDMIEDTPLSIAKLLLSHVPRSRNSTRVQILISPLQFSIAGDLSVSNPQPAFLSSMYENETDETFCTDSHCVIASLICVVCRLR